MRVQEMGQIIEPLAALYEANGGIAPSQPTPSAAQSSNGSNPRLDPLTNVIMPVGATLGQAAWTYVDRTFFGGWGTIVTGAGAGGIFNLLAAAAPGLSANGDLLEDHLDRLPHAPNQPNYLLPGDPQYVPGRPGLWRKLIYTGPIAGWSRRGGIFVGLPPSISPVPIEVFRSASFNYLLVPADKAARDWLANQRRCASAGTPTAPWSIKSIPFVTPGATPPAQVGAMPTNKGEALLYLSNNIVRIKTLLVNQIDALLVRKPRENYENMTAADRATIANAMADAYITAVYELLNNHTFVWPNMPKSWFAPVCTAQAQEIYESLRRLMKREVRLSDGSQVPLDFIFELDSWSSVHSYENSVQNWIDTNYHGVGIQNFNTITTRGGDSYSPKRIEDQGFPFLILDTYFTILPTAYDPSNYPCRGYWLPKEHINTTTEELFEERRQHRPFRPLRPNPYLPKL
jgi:hypothetical protein